MSELLNYDTILNNITNGVLTLDAKDGHIIYVNDACCEILEMEKENLVGSTIIDCIESNKINDDFIEYLLRCVSDKGHSHDGCVDYFKTRIKRLQIRTEYYEDESHPRIGMVISDITMAERMSEMLNLYMSKDVAAMLKNEPGATLIGGEKRDVSIMFADVRGFTKLSETLDPDNLVKILNRYLSTMIKVIHSYGGTITSFLGDGLVVVFGAPKDLENHADHSIACAIDMERYINEVNNWCYDNNLPELSIGIGIDSGIIFAGNIGSEEHIKYDVIGLVVNTAARIESFTSGGQILISEHTKKAAKDSLKIIYDTEVLAKGISKPVKVYDVKGIDGNFHLEIE